MPTVLVIDDRVTNRKVLSRLAASVDEEMTVRCFANAQAALEWARDAVPDLVVTDYRMPGMNGASFTEAFRSLPGCRDVPVVVVTVYEDRDYCYRALEAGATDFLLSPLDHQEFRARARNLLSSRRQQQALERRATALERELLEGAARHEAALRATSEHPFSRLLDTVPAIVTAVDATGRLTLVNGHHQTVYGLQPGDVLGRTLTEVYDADVARRHADLDARVFGTGETIPAFQEEILGDGGTPRLLLTTKAPLLNGSGAVTHVITVALDITGLRRHDAAGEQQRHDALTGLGDRELFRARLDDALQQVGRGDGGANGTLALFLLDLNRFKSVNDVFGHRHGDLLLKAVAVRLAGALNETDILARLGGDEFAVLRRDLRDPEEAAELARRLSATFGQPFACEGHEIHSGASIGIALYPTDGRAADQLLKNAELAMYRAKASGHNAFRFFAAEMNRTARRTGLLEREFRQGLAGEQFTIHFQPQLELRGGRIIGTEALVRWRHPRRGLVRPGEFIPLAEDTGLIAPLTVWVLRRAFRQFQAWQAAGAPDLRLSVNLSPVQFRERGTELLIERILDETGLDPAYLDIELTESVVVASTEAAGASLRHLHRRGVTLSIDDFGTGYSSLVYLKSLPVHRLKIDRGFIHKLGENAHDEAIVRAIINLAHSLNLKVLAEGVETETQLRHLRQLDCDEIQGDLFSPPLPAEKFYELFLKHSGLRSTETAEPPRIGIP